MSLWTIFVGILQTLIFALSQAYGGNIGLAIISISLIIRLALMPLTLKIALRALKYQTIMRKLQPALKRLQEKYKTDPIKLAQKSSALYKRYNVRIVDGLSFIGAAIQAPIVLGLYSAIRKGIGAGGSFLWIADLAKPDFILTAIIGFLTCIIMAAGPDIAGQNKTVSIIVSTAITMFITWQMAAGIGLYWAASSSVGIAEKIILRFKLKRLSPEING